MLRSPRVLAAAAGLCAAAAAVLIVVALAGSSTDSSPASVSRRAPLETVFEDDVRMDSDPAATLTTLRGLGVDRVRVFVPWGAISGRPSITPDPASRRRPAFDASDPAAYPKDGWTIYDRIVRAAAAQKVGLDFDVGAPAPLWATASGQPPGPLGSWRPSATAFGQFMRAIGTRYDGRYPDPLHPGRTLPRVDFWSIWNEPNNGFDIAPQATHHSTVEVSPAIYRSLVDAAWSALGATGHGGDTILIGELAPLGQNLGNHPGDFGDMVPLRFLRALYCVDPNYQPLRGAAATLRACPATDAGSSAFAAQHPALFKATAFSDHPYTGTFAPNVPTPGEPEWADFGALPRLESTLDRLQQAYGSSTRFPIYSTEFGYITTPPEHLHLAVSPATAAAYLNWAEYLSWRDPRIRSFDQYLLSDPPGGNFPNGLQFADGTPKPSYFAFRMPLFLPVTAVRSGDELEVWGRVGPARDAGAATGRAQRVKIQFKADGAKRFVLTREITLGDPHGFFDVRLPFRASGSIRTAWSYPGGSEIFSRTVHVTVR